MATKWFVSRNNREKRWVPYNTIKNPTVMATLGCRPGFIVKPSTNPPLVYKWVQSAFPLILVKEGEEDAVFESANITSRPPEDVDMTRTESNEFESSNVDLKTSQDSLYGADDQLMQDTAETFNE